MRISDWSSDVCSSDLLLTELVAEPDEMTLLPDAREIAATAWRTLQLPEIAALRGRLIPEWPVSDMLEDRPAPAALAGRIDAIADRKSVVEGKSVSVRVDLGGGRSITKTKTMTSKTNN